MNSMRLVTASAAKGGLRIVARDSYLSPHWFMFDHPPVPSYDEPYSRFDSETNHVGNLAYKLCNYLKLLVRT